MNAASFQPGDVLAGKYRVERVIGTGGIGMVVEAVQAQLERQVAIKLLLPTVSEHPEIVARFAREARAAARLKGEHVTRVLDVGQLENGAPYMVMEYLEGCDLGELLSRRGRLGVEETLEYVLQACEAVAEAHGVGIVHRDLKPANLFLTRTADGSPLIKVLDFGISKALTGDQAEPFSLTSSSSVVGTPLYMSPEQMKNARAVDVRTDIWSLGAILYELLAGRPPFLARSLAELCVMVMQQEPPSIRRLRPELPEGLVLVVECCLRKRAPDRYQNVLALAEALAECAAPESQLTLARIARLSGRSSSKSEPSTIDEVSPTVRAPLSEGGAPAVTPGFADPGAGSLAEPPAFSPVPPETAQSWGMGNDGARLGLAGARARRRLVLGVVGFAACVLVLAVLLKRRDPDLPADSAPRVQAVLASSASARAAPIASAALEPAAAPSVPWPASAPAAARSAPVIEPAPVPASTVRPVPVRRSAPAKSSDLFLRDRE